MLSIAVIGAGRTPLSGAKRSHARGVLLVLDAPARDPQGFPVR